MDFYAHSLAGRPTEEWEPLEEHLQAVAELAGEFAAKFGAREWGRVAGLWHDVGKYSHKFQAYLLTQNGLEAHLEQHSKVDHSTAGAQHAHRSIQPWGRLLAYVLAGHHAGLADATGTRASLDARLQNTAIERYDATPAELLQSMDLSPPALTIDVADQSRAAFQLSLFTRMLFSCLVDADFLATEKFMSPDRAKQRPQESEMLEKMEVELDAHLAELAASATPNEVGLARQEVLAACRAAAEQPPGLFSLTVPTGGGKTLASLAFAVSHARRYGFDRVIYAIPFTSIIEQTGDVFRSVFSQLGDGVVLEHHSNVDPEDLKKQTPLSRLATENWDAPLVVSTNVQLFESLFAARTSSCRKLHNLVGSVIILDEAQTLPVDLLRPCLALLRELATDYRCSIVLCTATQPALARRDGFSIGLEGVREIISEPAQLYRAMKRVDVRSIGQVTDDQLVERLLAEESFLCIVNTRPHAARIFDRLRQKTKESAGLFHLSTYLCGQHRSELIAEIRGRLSRDEPCRVVSTQLIEAGVDVDFPVVYRALSGIDSIAQAAGRCNREGKRSRGVVYVFEPLEVRLRGYLASVAATAGEVAPNFDDLLDPDAVNQYFELHYWKQTGENRWDARQVMDCFPTPVQEFAYNFRTAAERFRMIDDAAKNVFVPYRSKAKRLIKKLRREGPSRWLLRRLQRYSVGVYEHIYAKMLGSDIEELPGGYAVLINPDGYDKQLGLRVDRVGFYEPETLIA